VSKVSQTELSRLRWYCHRGMKELDVVLDEYLQNYFQNANQKEQHGFKELLQLEDPVLFSMLLGNHEPNNAQQAIILKTLGKLFSKK